MSRHGAILLVVPDETWPYGGNAVTAARIVSCLLSSGQEAEALPVSMLATRIAEGGVALIHALHVLKSGLASAEMARRLNIPYCLTFTGTDLNSAAETEVGRKRMVDVLSGARAVVVFHEPAARLATKLFPWLGDRLHVVPPGVTMLQEGALPQRLRLSANGFVFLLPAGLRAVKRPIFAVEPLARLRAEGCTDVELVLAGPVLEEAAYEAVVEACRRHPFVRYLGAVPHCAMGALFRRADVVLNTSVAEGLSNAVLEAMILGRPLLVAANEGNRAAVGEDGEAALLFSDEASFLAGARQLYRQPELRRALGEQARRRAERLFHPDSECHAYLQLYQEILGCSVKEVGRHSCEPWPS